MAFDPKAYLSKRSIAPVDETAFNPKDYLAKKKDELSPFQTAVKGFTETMKSSDTGLEKGLSLIGESAKAVADYAIPDFIEKGLSKVAQKILTLPVPQPMGMQTPTSIGEVISPAIEKGTEWAKQHPRASRNIGNVAAIAGLYPFGFGGGKAANIAVKKTGEAGVEAGKSLYLKQLKPKEVTIRTAYGKNMIEKYNNVKNDIVEFDLHNSKDFEAMNANAKNQFFDLDKQGKEIAKQVEIKQYATKTAEQKAAESATYNKMVARMNPDDPRLIAERTRVLAENLPSTPKKMSNPVAMVRNSMGETLKDLPTGYGTRDKIVNEYRKIIDDMKRDGMDANVPLSRLIEAKQKIVGNGDIFKLGVSPTIDDKLTAAIRKDIVYRFLDKIENLSPELREIGRKQKRLMVIADIADEAAFRTAKKDMMGLVSHGVLSGALIYAAPLAVSGEFKKAAAAVGAGAIQYGAQKMIERGAGPRRLIQAGQAFKKAATKPIGNMTRR